MFRICLRSPWFDHKKVIILSLDWNLLSGMTHWTQSTCFKVNLKVQFSYTYTFLWGFHAGVDMDENSVGDSEVADVLFHASKNFPNHKTKGWNNATTQPDSLIVFFTSETAILHFKTGFGW